jgi:DNA-binding transcriptional MerR regulator
MLYTHMTERLKSLKQKKYVGAVEFADEAARLVGQFVPRQERGSVTEVPDERMVRYYTAEGLLSAPEGRQGAAGIYGYTHLLQLLAVKRLQAEHLPIRKIRDMVEGKSTAELEQLLEGTGGGPARKNSALLYLESLLKPATAKPSAPPQAAPAAAAAQSASAAKSAWSRIEIEDGLELHVRDDYQLHDDARERQRLARTIINELDKQRK